MADMNVWAPFWKPRQAPRVRLFCFPYAGIGCGIYRRWSEYLPEDIDVVALQPPGRETRLFDPPFRRLEPLLDAVQDAITPLLDIPAAFFGHSLGALIAYELSRRVEPSWVGCVFASSRRPPHLPDTEKFLLDASQRGLLAAVKAVYRIPETELASEEFRTYVLPTLVADLELHDSYEHSPRAPLAFPLVALGGRGDESVRPTELAAWRDLTSASFSIEFFDGDHFYLNDNARAVCRCITKHLRPS